MKSDLAFIKETAIELLNKVSWLGIALAIVTAIMFAAPWLAE